MRDVLVLRCPDEGRTQDTEDPLPLSGEQFTAEVDRGSSACARDEDSPSTVLRAGAFGTIAL